MTHEIRDAAWHGYFLREGANWTAPDEEIAKRAFLSAWAERKAAQDRFSPHPTCPLHAPDAEPHARLCQHWHPDKAEH